MSLSPNIDSYSNINSFLNGAAKKKKHKKKTHTHTHGAWRKRAVSSWFPFKGRVHPQPLQIERGAASGSWLWNLFGFLEIHRTCWEPFKEPSAVLRNQTKTSQAERLSVPSEVETAWLPLPLPVPAPLDLEAWFQILAKGDAADLASAPNCPGPPTFSSDSLAVGGCFAHGNRKLRPRRDTINIFYNASGGRRHYKPAFLFESLWN